jgi:hypothetical protein
VQQLEALDALEGLGLLVEEEEPREERNDHTAEDDRAGLATRALLDRVRASVRNGD